MQKPSLSLDLEHIAETAIAAVHEAERKEALEKAAHHGIRKVIDTISALLQEKLPPGLDMERYHFILEMYKVISKLNDEGKVKIEKKNGELCLIIGEDLKIPASISREFHNNLLDYLLTEYLYKELIENGNKEKYNTVRFFFSEKLGLHYSFPLTYQRPVYF